MNKLLVLSLFLLNACGSSGGGAGGGLSSGAPNALPATNTHTFEMQVTTNDIVDFSFSPVLNGTDGSSLSPGLEHVVIGQTKTYMLDAPSADLQVSAVNGSNPAYFVTVIVLKDGVQINSQTLGNGAYKDFGTL